jgi:hypothetical protein
MARLDKERQDKLEPKRKDLALGRIKELGLEILLVTDSRIDFLFNDNKISYYPYSGWHTGKGIRDGRGWSNLKNQLTT